jgi:hypothetical protein
MNASDIAKQLKQEWSSSFKTIKWWNIDSLDER